MKDQKIDIKVNTTLDESENYEIVNNAHMARILSEQYANPIAAVIRELSTNAYDAHLEAGNLNPFEVSLYRGDVPELIIRDFGNGLSKEQLSEIYRKYGKSTKNESDDYVGMLGIGSKSPFAYTDSFTTISRNNGRKITVINAKNDEGLPKFYVASDVETSEPSGLEVKIPIKPSDIGTFISNMTEIYRWFEQKPKVNFTLGKSSYDNPLIKLDDFEIYSNTSSNSKVIMGNVAYNLSHIETQSILEELKIPYRNIAYIIKVNIGDVNFTPSREELMYTKKTIECIRDRFVVLRKVLNEEIQKLIDKCKCRFDANKLYFTHFQPNLSTLINDINYKYKGRPLCSDIDISTSSIECYSSWGKAMYPNIFSIRKYANSGFLYADKKTGRKQASRAALNAKGHSYVFCLQSKDSQDIQDFADLIGIDPSIIEPTSKYYQRVGQKRQSNVITDKGFIFCPNKDGIRNSYGSYNLHYWDHSADFDIKNHGLYVELNRYNVIHSKINSYGGIYNLMSTMAKQFIHFANIYGIKSAYIKEVEKTGKWKNAIDYMESFIKSNNIIKKEKEKSVISQNIYGLLSTNYITRHFSLRKDVFPELNRLYAKLVPTKINEDLAKIIDCYNGVFKDTIKISVDESALQPIKDYIKTIESFKMYRFTNYYQRFDEVEYLIKLEAKDKNFKL